MVTNLFVVIMLCVFITLLIIGLVIVIIYSVTRARKISLTTVYNPRELEVHYYQREEPGSNLYKRVELEELDGVTEITGIAVYKERYIEFYLSDKVFENPTKGNKEEEKPNEGNGSGRKYGPDVEEEFLNNIGY